jgi:molybdopterin-guanine dinucleotide biosynthesis protein A
MSQATRAAESTPPRETLPALHGLVLSGGASTRMGKDKALLDWHGEPQLQATFRLLSGHVRSCFVSLRSDQRAESVRAALPGIVDEIEGAGSAAGLLAAHAAYPEAAWLVLACDLPLLQASTLEALIRARDGQRAAIAYRSPIDGLPEPLCALWEPAALARLSLQAQAGRYGLREVLRSTDTLLLPARDNGELDNINTPQERQRLDLRMERGSSE